MSSAKEPRFFGSEYIAALKKHYPEYVQEGRLETIDQELHIGLIAQWMQNLKIVGVEGSSRFQSIAQRPWNSDMSAWTTSGGGPDLRRRGAFGSYKGLILMKPAVDLVLYSNLIWELQPHTILEFGSLQGGSAVWFADQLMVLCGRGQVHSFELCYKCISPRAVHPLLQFHEADFRDLQSLDPELLERLAHPWIVVDDAHENLSNLIPFIAKYMKAGDYYVVEDSFAHVAAPRIQTIVDRWQNLGFLVDTRYVDAFGTNVTCALNGWLVKQ